MCSNVWHSLSFPGMSLQAESQINFKKLFNYTPKDVAKVPWHLTEKIILNTQHVFLSGVAQGDRPMGQSTELGVGGFGFRFISPVSHSSRLGHCGQVLGSRPQCSRHGVVVLNTGVNEVASKKAICNLGSARHLLITQPRGRGRVLAIVVYSAWFLTRIVKNSGTITDEISEMKILCRG